MDKSSSRRVVEPSSFIQTDTQLDDLKTRSLEDSTTPSADDSTIRRRKNRPRVRAAIAVVVTRFPRIDETFILREITELERNGQPVLVVPLLPGGERVVHEEAKSWVKRALYTPLLSLPIFRSNLNVFLKTPLAYLGLLFRLFASTLVRPSTMIRTLAFFPKSVHLSLVLKRLGIRHVHAHFASHATTWDPLESTCRHASLSIL